MLITTFPKHSSPKGESSGGRDVVLSYIEEAIPGQSIHTGSGGSTLGKVCLHHTQSILNPVYAALLSDVFTKKLISPKSVHQISIFITKKHVFTQKKYVHKNHAMFSPKKHVFTKKYFFTGAACLGLVFK